MKCPPSWFVDEDPILLATLFSVIKFHDDEVERESKKRR